MSHERLKPEYLFDEEKINKLKQLAPECFEDGKINFETLKQNLGDWAQDHEDSELEHFGLFWPGKKDARRIAAIPPEGTLVPVYGEGLKTDGTPDTDGVNDSKNIFIEGENLEVLKILQKSYAGKIKMIYIDPPYNTGNDFVYDDDFTEPLQEYLRRTGQVDEEGKALTTNKRSDGRFHSKWLSMMYPRLKLARNLLSEDGVIFMSIDDNEIHNLRAICNEIFGEENFVEQIIWTKNTTKNDSKDFATVHEYVLLFAKNREYRKNNELFYRIPKPGLEEVKSLVEDWKDKSFSREEAEKTLRVFYKNNKEFKGISQYKHVEKEGKDFLIFREDNAAWPQGTGPMYDIIHPVTGKPCSKPKRGWRWKEETMNGLLEKNLIVFGEDESKVPQFKRYLHTMESDIMKSHIANNDNGENDVRNLFSIESSYFEHPKPVSLIKYLISGVEFIEEESKLILDFFAGSGTTGHSTYEIEETWNYILVQIPELVPEKSEAHNNGYKKISSITCDRLRLASSSNGLSNGGFKVAHLEKSNYKKWSNYSGTSLTDLESQMELYNQEPLREGWTNKGLLSEIILMEGFVLSSTIVKQDQYKKNEVKKVSDEYCEHSLLVCLDEKIDPQTIESLDLSGGDIFICLDSAISNVDKLRLSDKGLIKTI